MLRYSLRGNWLFYLLVTAYGVLIVRMTLSLWFGDGINIFASYSAASTASEMIVDANYVYWSKTCFLFMTLLLVSLRFDCRFAIGVACTFWATSLITMFGASTVLLVAGVLGVSIALLQVYRGEVMEAR
jgi:hypothetical protein